MSSSRLPLIRGPNPVARALAGRATPGQPTFCDSRAKIVRPKKGRGSYDRRRIAPERD